ncbi:MAG TPA: DUF1674 domain-containing protein [Gammaproteobacteria bacterium]|nr:DUF1674 domain-containing protein [Gammaproteobacteria bacterium]
MSQPDTKKKPAAPEPQARATGPQPIPLPRPKEINGPKGPEPTRYGDWEKNGRCIDF